MQKIGDEAMLRTCFVMLYHETDQVSAIPFNFSLIISGLHNNRRSAQAQFYLGCEVK